MDDGSRWNVPLVWDTFWPEEVKTILSIPINKRGGEDKMIWVLHPNGNFIVKSAYYATINSHKDVEGSNSQGCWEKDH